MKDVEEHQTDLEGGKHLKLLDRNCQKVKKTARIVLGNKALKINIKFYENF